MFVLTLIKYYTYILNHKSTNFSNMRYYLCRLSLNFSLAFIIHNYVSTFIVKVNIVNQY